MAFLTDISHRLAESPVTKLLLLSALAVLPLRALIRRGKILVWLPGPPTGNWITGHFTSFLGPNSTAFHEELITTYGPTLKINGGFGAEIIFTIDPAMMHTVLVKDKGKFERPDGATLMLRLIFGGGLLGLTREDHRVQRKLLNPVFTMKFLRELMPTFMNVARQTSQGIKKDLTNANSPSKELDVFPWATIAALELVGEAGLGYSFNSFTGERNEYYNAIKSVMQVFTRLVPFMEILPFMYRSSTPLLRRWAVKYTPIGALQTLRHAVNLQNNQAEEVLRARQALISSGADLSSQTGRGRDIVTLLMKANEAEGSTIQIDHQEMIGHMNIFVFAGHETTSTAVARILDILAKHPLSQTRLREEVQQYFETNPDDSRHDGLLELPYLDAIVRETLRLYEPLSLLPRVCKEDTTIPLEYPIDTPSGKITSIPVKKGTVILMSIPMANRYEKIWGDRAREFLPERWIRNKLEEVTQPGAHLPGVYSSIMTFGAGSHSCIGFKFAVMEIKAVIAQLVNDFMFEPSDKEHVWETFGIQFPYLKGDKNGPNRLPRLPLRVTAL